MDGGGEMGLSMGWDELAMIGAATKSLLFSNEWYPKDPCMVYLPTFG